jgi:hypothetical protein
MSQVCGTTSDVTATHPPPHELFEPVGVLLQKVRVAMSRDGQGVCDVFRQSQAWLTNCKRTQSELV